MRVKCTHTVKTKNGSAIECGRFLGEQLTNQVKIRCPRCGGDTIIQTAQEIDISTLANMLGGYIIGRDPCGGVDEKDAKEGISHK